MMWKLRVLLLLSTTSYYICWGFSYDASHQEVRFRTQTTGTKPLVVSTLRMVGDEAGDGDDWYSDFDPSTDYTGGRYGKDPSSRPSNRRFWDNDRQGNRSSSSRDGYLRDTSRDNSNVDEKAVGDLIRQRSEARRDGNFKLADLLRDVLLDDHGVRVFDRDRLWRSGCSRSGSGMPGRRKGPVDFGPKGHDYEMSPLAKSVESDLSLDQINAMLAERLQHKLGRQFGEADKIQQTLIEHGVYIHDGRKEWRADGISMFSTGGTYQEAPTSSLSDDDINLRDEITKLVAKRSQLRKVRDYDEADRIQDVLRKQYGVLLNDKRLEWTVVDVAEKKQVLHQPAGDDPKMYDDAAEEDNESYVDDETMEDDDIAEVNCASLEDELAEESDHKDQLESDSTLTTLTVVQLKTKLKEAGLPVSGRKADLIERLMADGH